jgi:hypothetical protein
MAALSATTPARTGTATSGAAVAASDTIAVSVMGPYGCLLEIINGNASTDSMTISDSGVTPAGTSPGTYAGSVTNATSKIFLIRPSQADTATGNVTVTHSVTSSVTYKLYPIS